MEPDEFNDDPAVKKLRAILRANAEARGEKLPEDMTLADVFSSEWTGQKVLIDGELVDITYKINDDGEYVFQSVPQGVPRELLVKSVKIARYNDGVYEGGYAKYRSPVIDTKKRTIKLDLISPCDGEGL